MGGFLNLHNGPNTVDSDSDESPNKLWRELAVQVRDSKRYLEYCQRPSMTGRAKGSLPRHASSGTLHRETSWNVNLSSLNYRSSHPTISASNVSLGQHRLLHRYVS